MQEKVMEDTEQEATGDGRSRSFIWPENCQVKLLFFWELLIPAL